MRLHRRSSHLLLLLAVLGVGLPPSRAEAAAGAAGAPCATPVLVKDIAGGGADASAAELVSVGGILFFAANDGVHGQELWRSDGTPEGTQLVKDILVGAEGASPTELTELGGVLFFRVSTSGGTELWKSDGTEAGTVRVKGFPPQFLPSELTAVGSTLLFVADDGLTGQELWRSDGTEPGTVRVRDILPGAEGSFPEGLTVMSGVLFFRANDGSTGYELWKSDGTEPGTVRVKDIAPGGAHGAPGSLTVVGQTLFFTAIGQPSSATLWKSDGTGPGTVLVKDLFDREFHPSPQELTAVGGTLFFTIDDEVNGQELWRSDGTEAGTVLVKDIHPGGESSAPALLTAVGGMLFFVADDGVSGTELWRSDGTTLGTRRVRDIVSSGSAAFSLLAPGPGLLLLVVDDGVSGSELWRSDGTEAGTFLLADLAPGVDQSTPRALTSSGAQLFFVARSPTQGEELFVLPLTGVDCTAPSISCPVDQQVEAISSAGTSFAFPRAVASDDSLWEPTVSYSHPPGSSFPLGDTAVLATARDAAGHTSQCTFHVSVRDTTAPLLLLCPAGVVQQEATSAAGAIFSYYVLASDSVAAPVVEYSHPSGGTFPLGETPISITARDAAGNTSRCDFTLVVRDTQAPRLTCPEDVTRLATSAEGVPISYEVAAQDAASVPQVSASHASGSLFPVGETPVTVTARDAAGNTSQCTFRVHRVDPVGPTITCPEAQQGVGSEGAGAVVSFPEAIATDNLAPPAVSYSHEPGSTFAVGETVVTATARDLGGHTASCTFTVTVVEGSGAGPGCQAGASGVSLGWLLVALLPLWARRRAAREVCHLAPPGA